ncbi:MAG: carboxypeptidase regulatory-like domain-containing protein [Gemmatimonadaceae bacterium]
MKLSSGIAAMLLALTASANVGSTAAAQTPPPPPPVSPVAPPKPEQPGTLVTGTIYDSLSSRPLVGAVVQLVSGDPANAFAGTISSDEAGRYSFKDVPDGKYSLGFFHPLLDSLGMQGVARAVSINRQGAVRFDLAVPPAARMRDVLCGPRTPASTGGVAIGTVFSAQKRLPLKDVKITGQWFEVSIGVGGVSRRNPRRTTTSVDGGMFVLCDVPTSGAMSLIASSGADSTGIVEVEVPKGGFLRSDLYLGSATVAAADSVSKSDTLALRSNVVRVGTMRLTGSVVALDDGTPLNNAVVGITNGPQTRTNDRGQWTITNAPPGSQSLEVRAVGKYPVRRNVNVIDGTAPIRVAMTNFKTVLDTLKVTAGLSASLDYRDFETRRRSQGMGRFFTADDIRKRNVLETSDLFKAIPNVDVVTLGLGQTVFQMKTAFRGETCTPTIVLNGTQMNNISADELDNMVRPERIIGIEVYTESNTPAKFQSGMSGCGSIVIWQRY